MPILNHTYLKHYFLNGFLMPKEFHNETMFEGIKRQSQAVCFNKVPESKLSFLEAQQAFAELLKTAVAKCLSKQKKVAVELSGGLDSSCLAYLTRKQLQEKKIYAFTHKIPDSCFYESTYDESPWSIKVTKELDLKQIFLNSEENLHKLIEESSEILGQFSEVLFPILNLPTLKIAKELGINTILSGFGGDEVVSGSGNLYLKELKDKKKYLDWVYEKSRKISFKKFKELLTVNIKNLEENHLTYLSDNLLQETQIKLLKHENINSREKNLTQGELSLHWKRRIEVSQTLASHYGISYEFPLVDRELMQFFHQLPSSYKYSHGQSRRMMRYFLKRNFLRSIGNRYDKAGCTTPAGRFFLIKNLPKVFLERIPENYRGVLSDYLNLKKVRKRLEEGPCSSSGILRILVAALMIYHLEKNSWKKSLLN